MLTHHFCPLSKPEERSGRCDAPGNKTPQATARSAPLQGEPLGAVGIEGRRRRSTPQPLKGRLETVQSPTISLAGRPADCCAPKWLPVRGAGSRRLTERCCRSALCKRLARIATALTPLRHGFAMPPPLKGRLETVQSPTISLAGRLETVQSPTLSLAGRLEKGVIPCFHGIPNYSAMPGGFGGR